MNIAYIKEEGLVYISHEVSYGSRGKKKTERFNAKPTFLLFEALGSRVVKVHFDVAPPEWLVESCTVYNGKYKLFTSGNGFSLVYTEAYYQSHNPLFKGHIEAWFRNSCDPLHDEYKAILLENIENVQWNLTYRKEFFDLLKLGYQSSEFDINYGTLNYREYSTDFKVSADDDENAKTPTVSQWEHLISELIKEPIHISNPLPVSSLISNADTDVEDEDVDVETDVEDADSTPVSEESWEFTLPDTIEIHGLDESPSFEIAIPTFKLPEPEVESIIDVKLPSFFSTDEEPVSVDDEIVEDVRAETIEFVQPTIIYNSDELDLVQVDEPIELEEVQVNEPIDEPSNEKDDLMTENTTDEVPNVKSEVSKPKRKRAKKSEAIEGQSFLF